MKRRVERKLTSHLYLLIFNTLDYIYLGTVFQNTATYKRKWSYCFHRCKCLHSNKDCWNIHRTLKYKNKSTLYGRNWVLITIIVLFNGEKTFRFYLPVYLHISFLYECEDRCSWIFFCRWRKFLRSNRGYWCIRYNLSIQNVGKLIP